MSYIALYRKWRPLSFDEVVGQETTVRVLKNTVLSGKIAHAYLFCGTRGTGKTSIAKIFSRAVNCLDSHDGNPCNKCDVCKGLLDGSLPDVMEIDAASNNGVDNIRAIIEDSVYSTFKAKYRVYIIDEVHMLSQGAFNALLKTLEEPPANVVFILATTEPQKLPATIISRCIRFNFKRISVGDTAARLKEICDSIEVGYDEEALTFLARKGEGALRDAISLLDQTISSSDGYITLQKARDATGSMDRSFSEQLAKAIIESNGMEIIPMVDQIFSSGVDPAAMISDLISVFRDILVVVTVRKPEGMVESSVADLLQLAKATSSREVVFFIKELSDLENRIKWSVERKTVFEAGLLALCDRHFTEDTDYEKRLKFLEERVSDLVASGVKIAVSGGAPVKKEAKQPKEEASEQQQNQEQEPLKESSSGAEQEKKKKTPENMNLMDEHDKMDFKSGMSSRQGGSVCALIDVNAELYADDDTVYIVFSNRIMMQILKNDATQKIMEESASEVYGRKTNVRVLLREEFETLTKTVKKEQKKESKEESDKRDFENSTLEALREMSKAQGFEITEE